MVTSAQFTPGRGDIIWLSFSPTEGHEQKGRRPALVLSPQSYNRKTGLVLACPVTSRRKGYPFEVAVSVFDTDSAVLADQIRCLAWRERNAEKIRRAPAAVLAETTGKLRAILFED